ncbi:MAG TPA: hypothetical protein VNI84_13830 [Pyrinomonadaceae bacterium]|nr:hypothetical protein [Pyrinomonadaceae bacterium]
MLKPSYDSEDKIPDNLKGAYVADSSGTWILDDLDKEHPILRKNSELQREKNTLSTQNTKLSNDKTLAESKSIPEGYVAVKAEDAPVIEKFRAAGVSLEELPQLKTKVEAFERERREAASLDYRKSISKKLGYDNADAFARLAERLDIVPEGDADFVQFKNNKGEIEKKPLTKEFVESSDVFKPFLSSLNVEQQTKPGNMHDPKPHTATKEDLARGEVAAQIATGRYSL